MKIINYKIKNFHQGFTLIEAIVATAVFAFVVVMAIFLWVSDKTLEWVLYDLILGWKHT